MQNIGGSSRARANVTEEVGSTTGQDSIEVSNFQTSASALATNAVVDKTPITLPEAQVLLQELKSLSDAFVEIDAVSPDADALKAQFLAKFGNEVQTRAFQADDYQTDRDLKNIRKAMTELFLLVADKVPSAAREHAQLDAGEASITNDVELLSRKQISDLSEDEIKVFSEEKFKALSKHMEKQFNERINRTDVEAKQARETYDNFVIFTDARYQQTELSESYINLLNNMETALILNGQLMDKTKESVIPSFSAAELAGFSEKQMTNLVEHMFDKAARYIQSPAEVKSIYKETASLIEQKYSTGELPNKIQDSKGKFLNFASGFGIDLEKDE